MKKNIFIKNLKRSKYGKALLKAAEEAYKNEIAKTLMEDLVIGETGSWDSKEDWMDCKIAEWLDE